MGNACTMHSGNSDSQPSDSPGNLENMPCGLAVKTLAQKEARPQTIWWGEKPSLSLQCFNSSSEVDFVPLRKHQRHNKAEKRKNNKFFCCDCGEAKAQSIKGNVRNQTASRG